MSQEYINVNLPENVPQHPDVPALSMADWADVKSSGFVMAWRASVQHRQTCADAMLFAGSSVLGSTGTTCIRLFLFSCPLMAV